MGGTEEKEKKKKKKEQSHGGGVGGVDGALAHTAVAGGNADRKAHERAHTKQ